MASPNHFRFDELKAAGQLPSPTGVALAILKLMQKEGTTVQEIARVLQADPALTGRILKMANSAAIGATRPVATVQEAMVRLGTRLVRQLSLGFSVLTSSRTGACKAFDYGAFWSRSLAMAVAAQAASRRFKVIGADEAFTCGLLTHVGSLGLACIYPAEYSEILAVHKDNSIEQLIVQERTRFATDQIELGAALLEDWGLPEVCVEAVRLYGQSDGCGISDQSRSGSIAVVLELAARLAAICVATDANREQLVGHLFECAARLDISTSELIPLCDQVVNEWRDWGETLQVITQEVPPFSELAERNKQLELASAPELSTSESGKAVHLDTLIIDDDPSSITWLSSELQSAGHRVRASRDCEEGLRIILETKPHLVLLNWAWAGPKGAELCRTLRETQTGRNIYVVVILDASNENEFMNALAAGASDYITKPMRREILAARVRACQRLAQLQDELSRDKEELRRCLAQLAVANRQSQQAALTDALTGLPNRRCMIDRFTQEWASAIRHDRELSCMLLDLDHFKLVNDRHGHDVGDIVLKRTAAVLRSALRRSDIVCRLAGEEFVVICPDTTVESAANGAERLRKAVESSIIDVPGFNRAVTVSIGVAARTSNTEDPDALLKAADGALYEAKRNGRNRTCVAPGDVPAEQQSPVTCAAC